MNKLPVDFIEEIASLFDTKTEREAFLFSISEDEPPVSIRLNPYKSLDLSNLETVSWCNYGKYLPDRPSFTMDPLFWGGAYYPQEASSMVVGEIVKKLSPKKILDLCAAPGGKTTHISSVISDTSLLISNEVVPNRAKTLAENVQRWGIGNVIVTNAQPKTFSNLQGYFDLILADVPCSGEGMFRKDPKSITEWSIKSVAACVSRSKTILTDVWNALVVGGYLIFSTCTYNKSEDEEMVNYIVNDLGADYIPIDNIVPPSVTSTGAGYHFLPHRVKGEGFFVALLQKTSENHYVECRLRNINSFKRIPTFARSVVQDYSSCQLDFYQIGENFYGFSDVIASEIDYIRSAVSPIYAGIQFGKIFSNKLKPSQALAYYTKMTYDSVSDLPLDEAIHYLRKDSQNPELFTPGLSAVRYKNVILGWANRVQGRVNNLYPSEMRIRMSDNLNNK